MQAPSIGHTSIVLASALAFALLMLIASEPAVAAGGMPQAVLLATSTSIKTQVDAAERHRVMRELAALQFGPIATVISPQELDARLGPNLRPTPASPENPLDEVDIEARAFPGIAEQPLQSQIPFGFAAIGWGFRHSTDGWRLFLPDLTATPRAPAGTHGATGPGRHDLGAPQSPVRLP